MSRTPRGRPPRWARSLFRAAVKAYPGAFRRRHGADMDAAFADAWRDARPRGRRATAAMLARTVVDLVLAGLRERMDPAPDPHSPPPHPKASPMDVLLQDLRFALRSLWRRPGFTAVAVITLALGVGANTAIFSVVNGVLLRPLPWDDPEELVTVWAGDVGDPDPRGVMSRPDILDIRATDAFETLVGYSGGSVALTGMGEAEVVPAARVTEGLMATFGLAPHLGRDLTLEDSREGGPDVVVLSHGFWQERLGGDRDALGTTLELQGRPHTVVGVAPPGFDFPERSRMWRPSYDNPEGCGRGCHTVRAVGRLADGIDLEGARAVLEPLALRLEEAFPESNFEKRFNPVSLEDYVVGDVRAGLWMLLGAAGLVLLIACANVANLLLVRAQGRRGEVAVRSALGASRGRLVGQVLVESLVLAVLGGAAGLVLASLGVDVLKALAPASVPRLEAVSVDGTVLLFTLGLVAAVALLFGLAPALRLARTAPAGELAAGGRGRSDGVGQARSRGALLAAEVALSLMLLVGAGLLLRSFGRMYAVDPGFETREVLRFTLSLPESSYPELEDVSGFYRALEERIAAIPGVEAAGSVFGAPMGAGNISGEVLVEGRPEPGPGEETYASLKPVTPGYLSTLRIPVLRGRGIEPSDRSDAGAVAVAVVNETFVRQNFPGADPLGERMEVTADFGYAYPTYTTVGVVPDILSRSLTREPYPEVYVPQAQFGPGFMTVNVRSRPGAPPVLPAIRETVRSLDPDIPLRGVETIDEVIRAELAPTRFYLSLVGVFAALAVVLAAVGLYGVVSYLVSRRRREIGVRMALGARGASIARMVVSDGLRPAAWGVALGLLGAWAGSRLLASLLFEVEPTDPWTYAGVTVLLLGIVTAATLLPARSAGRVDPVEALKAE